MDPIMQDYQRWQQLATEDPDLGAELAAIAGKPAEIRDRFYRDLAFGTGGLRGVLGAGRNRMNLYTVRRATRGVAAWLCGQSDSPSAAVSYDSRRKSRLFAEQAARTLAACGVRVWLFPQLMPTPALSFAVRALGCSGGVMVTASHNPAAYNGYKVYGPDGCQITVQAAEQITQAIARADYFAPLPQPTAAIAEVPPAVTESFYAAVLAQRLEAAPAAPLRIVYTPLNGTGLVPVTEVLRRAGFAQVTVVRSQAQPDGNFPTCPYPNPEIPQALQEGLRCCRETGAELLLATDPDCDRVGAAVLHDGAYQPLTGNQMGVLLLDYICRRRTACGTMPDRPVAVKTIVTTDMARAVAEKYGVELREVLTGFKFIGEQIGLLEKQGQVQRYIFGFEESYGYLSGPHVRDKDAVNACLLICDMAAWYKSQGLDLCQAMDALYRAYGCYAEGLDAFTFDGEAGLAQMQRLMQGLRQQPPATLCGQQVLHCTDYLLPPGAQQPPAALPSSDVLQYRLADGTLLTLRPSGTEPKIKVYLSVRRGARAQATQDLQRYRAQMAALVQAAAH